MKVLLDEFQRKLPAFEIAVVVLRARSNRLADLRPLVPRLLEILPGARQGVATIVEI